jgi:hypothetical protein
VTTVFEDPFAGEDRGFAGRKERFPRATGDRAFVAVFIGEVRELQRDHARVFDDHLIVDGLADFPAQLRGRVAGFAARDLLKLLDREARLASDFDVVVEAAADTVGFPGRVSVDQVLAGDLEDRQRVGTRWAVEAEGRLADHFTVHRDELGDGVVFRVGEAFEGEVDVGAGDFGFPDSRPGVGT